MGEARGAAGAGDEGHVRQGHRAVARPVYEQDGAAHAHGVGQRIAAEGRARHLRPHQAAQEPVRRAGDARQPPEGAAGRRERHDARGRRLRRRLEGQVPALAVPDEGRWARSRPGREASSRAAARRRRRAAGRRASSGARRPRRRCRACRTAAPPRRAGRARGRSRGTCRPAGRRRRRRGSEGPKPPTSTAPGWGPAPGGTVSVPEQRDAAGDRDDTGRSTGAEGVADTSRRALMRAEITSLTVAAPAPECPRPGAPVSCPGGRGPAGRAADRL